MASFNELRAIKKARGKHVKGLLELLIFEALREKEMTGYDLIRPISTTFEVLLSPGSLYPMLDNLEQQGLIEGRVSSKKRIYKLTIKGEDLCHSISLEYMKVASKVASFLQKE